MFSSLELSLQSKLAQPLNQTFMLGVGAGVYISLGATLYSIVVSLPGPSVPLKLAGALLFTIGLNLVIFLKAQLFTGNNLLVMFLMQKKADLFPVMRNWLIVYLGNLVGSIASVILVTLIFNQFETLSQKAVAIAELKTSYVWYESFFRAIACNILVCIGVLLGVIMDKLWQKIIGIIVPITLFVFLGFEHSIANMFFIPVGLWIKNTTVDTSLSLFLGNLIPVTLGNILGGTLVSLLLTRSKVLP